MPEWDPGAIVNEFRQVPMLRGPGIDPATYPVAVRLISEALRRANLKAGYVEQSADQYDSVAGELMRDMSCYDHTRRVVAWVALVWPLYELEQQEVAGA